jgi:hypothetical protein
MSQHTWECLSQRFFLDRDQPGGIFEDRLKGKPRGMLEERFGTVEKVVPRPDKTYIIEEFGGDSFANELAQGVKNVHAIRERKHVVIVWDDVVGEDTEAAASSVPRRWSVAVYVYVWG